MVAPEAVQAENLMTESHVSSLINQPRCEKTCLPTRSDKNRTVRSWKMARG